jgi:hypothetical protein
MEERGQLHALSTLTVEKEHPVITGYGDVLLML